MDKIGYGHGSDWQLTLFLGRHRNHLTSIVPNVRNVSELVWLDFTFKRRDWLGDGELLGLAFLPDVGIQEEFRSW